MLVVMFLTGCNNPSEKKHFQKSYSLDIVDSVRVDYLGNFYLSDYSSERDEYLAKGHGDREFLFLDAEGNIVDSVRLKKDGPDAIAGVQVAGFVDGHLSILEGVKGLLVLGDEGKLDKRHEISGNYYYLNGYKGRPFFKLQEELAYYRPERGDLPGEGLGEIMKSVYEKPILEVLNPRTGDFRSTMAFPSTSKFKDGEYHGWPFPTVIKQGDVWLLYFAREYQFYIYREKEGDLKLQQTVKMKVPDAISAEGVPFDKADQFEKSIGLSGVEG